MDNVDSWLGHFADTNEAFVLLLKLVRYLQHLGYEVNYIRNFTDVDDKVL